MKGISERNLKYMRAFAAAYPSFVQVPLAQIETDNKSGINETVQGRLAQITWYHHITLLDKVKDEQQRNYYIAKNHRKWLEPGCYGQSNRVRASFEAREDAA